MSDDTVHQFTAETFGREVLDADTPVLVDFWAEWCMPCKIIEDTIRELAGVYAGRVKVGKVDTDANRSLVTDHGISALPTVIVFSRGQVAARFIGLTSRDDLAGALDDALASADTQAS